MYTGSKHPAAGIVLHRGLGGREVNRARRGKDDRHRVQAAQGKAQPLTQWIGLRG